MRRTFRRNSSRAFTLIELLLVMVILVVLAGVVVTRFGNRTEQARDAAAKTDISAIDTALEAFQVDCQRYPTNEEGLSALITAPGGVQDKWKGPYLKRNALPMDPWNNQYVYRYPGTHNTSGYDLFSMGADGREGGDDVDNWSVQR
jgi:general secretion pathway protein G